MRSAGPGDGSRLIENRTTHDATSLIRQVTRHNVTITRIAGLQRHDDVAAEQIARINADFPALTGDGDGLRVAETGVIIPAS
jgi:hypothetical protein